jgi:NADH-quinone oxidoreductase subunit E
MTPKAQNKGAMKVSRTVSKAVGAYHKDQDMLVQILLDLQSKFGWLSREVLAEVSGQLEVPVTRVCQIASYYKAFSLMPRGRHTIKVCMGTACQVRGSPQLLDRISAMLDLEPSETSQDRRFTLETVNCLGCCAMGPVLVVDDRYHRKPSTPDLKKILGAAK